MLYDYAYILVDLTMTGEIRLGLKENAGQFTLLVIANAFVGGMIGLERSILPQIAEAEFQTVGGRIAIENRGNDDLAVIVHIGVDFQKLPA